jgi:hypothetical protein
MAERCIYPEKAHRVHVERLAAGGGKRSEARGRGAREVGLPEGRKGLLLLILVVPFGWVTSLAIAQYSV